MTSSPVPPGGLFDGPLHRVAVRAYFEDTDLSGVVYHANYLRWFERARSDMLRLLGIDQRAVHEAGEGAYAVSELTIRYRVPARLDDTVLIESRAEELRAASCRMHQIAWRDDVLLAEARLRVRRVITEHLMTLELGGGARLRLGRDLERVFPASLATLSDPDLLALLARIDPTPDGTARSGASDWADLTERMHYIADLFRCCHEAPELFLPPFAPGQVSAIRAGHVPSAGL